VKLYLLVSSLLNAAGALVIAVSVMVAGRRNPRNALFAVFLFSVAGWSLCYFAWQMSQSAGWALFCSKALMAAAVFIPVSLSHFVSRLTGRSQSSVLVVGYLGAIVFAALSFTSLIVADVRVLEAYGYWPLPGPLFPVSLVFFAFYTIYSWVMLWPAWRQPDTPTAQQHRYILVALIVGFIGGSTNFPLWFDLPIPPIGNGVVLVYVVMMAHAITKYRLPGVNIDLARGVVFSCVALTIAVFYVIALAIQRTIFGGEVSTREMGLQLLAAVAVSGFFLWVAPRLRSGTERLMEQTLFRGRYVHRRELAELSARVFSINDEEEIFREAVAAIRQALAIGNAAVYFTSELRSGFQLRHADGYPEGMVLPSWLPEDHALAQILRRERTTVIYRQDEALPIADQRRLGEAHRIFGLEAVVPLHGYQSLLGFLVLGHPKREGFFSSPDLRLIEGLCLQIGLAVRARQLERRANQTEKLISLGTLAAGLAHELRNPLVSIKTFSALLPEHGGDVEFQQEFSQVMTRDVNRIAAIVENVAAFAEHNEVALSPVDLREVLRSVEEITREERIRCGNVALLWSAADPGLVQGNFTQLVQVFVNLVQNAAHALEGRPRAQVRVSWRPETAGSLGRCLHVDIQDNGPGIEPAIQARLFDPFVTTKSTGGNGTRRGMGLGLAIVKRIVDGHRGQIGVDSAAGEGTRFYLLLPAPADNADA
jgi:signal transduction histidine kinase